MKDILLVIAASLFVTLVITAIAGIFYGIIGSIVNIIFGL